MGVSKFWKFRSNADVLDWFDFCHSKRIVNRWTVYLNTGYLNTRMMPNRKPWFLVKYVNEEMGSPMIWMLVFRYYNDNQRPKYNILFSNFNINVETDRRWYNNGLCSNRTCWIEWLHWRIWIIWKCSDTIRFRIWRMSLSTWRRIL